MPRSGTTLLEQILSAHTEVSAGGEMSLLHRLAGGLCEGKQECTQYKIESIRNDYLSAVSQLSQGSTFITDKMPHNFRYIPAIVAALPEAKIIHIRRDPKATCWGNFKQYFVSDTLGYSCDLLDVVSYYHLYKGLMNLWETEFSDYIYSLDYEDLVANPEKEISSLLDFVRLPIEDECFNPHNNKKQVSTASSMQVRKPIYKGSSDKWRVYEPYLDGAFDSLDSRET